MGFYGVMVVQFSIMCLGPAAAYFGLVVQLNDPVGMLFPALSESNFFKWSWVLDGPC